MADNKAYQRKANISLVMKTIRVSREISRIAISRELGLDRSTITNIVSRLIDVELIVEKSQGTSISKGGRKPVYLGINPKFGVVLGLEIQVNFYRATLISIDGEILWNRCSHYERITDIYTEIIGEIDRCDCPLLGVGIGLPGQIDPVKGEVLHSSPLFEKRKEIRALSDLFTVPVVLDNDANCCAWGVLEDRKDSEIKNFLYSIVEFHGDRVLCESGDVGFGIVVNGDVYYGNNLDSGNLWQTNVPKESDSEFFDDLFDKLTLFVDFLNPSHLFLGGEFLKYKDRVLKLAEKRALYDKCEVVFSQLFQYEVSYGAAGMFIERLFKIPGVDRPLITDLNWENILCVRKSLMHK